MATQSANNAQTAFGFANLLDDAADAIRKRSKRDFAAGRISLDEYVQARARELELRSQASVLVASDLSEGLEAAGETGEDIEQAIVEAKGRIERVRSVKSALKIVAALVSLAGALVSGDAERIVEAGKAVKELV